MGTTDERGDFPAWAALAEANYCAFISSIPGAEVADTPHLLRIHTPLPTPLTNPALCRDLPNGDALDALIAETRAYFAARGGPYGWYVTPHTTPPDLGQILTGHGLVHKINSRSWRLISRRSPRPRPRRGAPSKRCAAGSPGPRGSGRLRRDMARPPALVGPFVIALEALGFGPGRPLRHFLARLDGAPVATATLFTGGGAAGIYNVATLPEARGRGIGAAVSHAALHAARAGGETVGVLQ